MARYLAEFLGTFFLVFAGTGAIIVNALSMAPQNVAAPVISHVGIALTFGLVVASMIYAFGDISGAHLNPAVTIAFTVGGKSPIIRLVPYLLCQCAGVLLASAVLFMLFPNDTTSLGATVPGMLQLSPNYEITAAMRAGYFEAILTAMLMFTILGVTSGGEIKGAFAGVAIGSMVGLEAMFAGPVCGASMNPARSLGPAVISGNMEHLWIYWLAPISGSVIAVLLWQHVLKKQTTTESEAT